MTDELSERRRMSSLAAELFDNENMSGGSGAYSDDDLAGGRKEKRPPLWRWFSAQTAHTKPEWRAAAIHVKDRWNLQFVRFSRIDRSLAKEESEFLIPFRELLDEYRIVFGVSDGDAAFAAETGVDGKLMPFAVEMCEKCGKREAIPGTGLCGRDGGQWLTEKDIAHVSQHLRQKLIIASESAIRTLQDLMDNAKSEQVRSQAAAMILDRAGLGAHMNVSHSGTVNILSSDEAMSELHARLNVLATNAERRAAVALEAGSGPSTVDGMGDIIDAEIVSETA